MHLYCELCKLVTLHYINTCLAIDEEVTVICSTCGDIYFIPISEITELRRLHNEGKTKAISI